MKNWLVLLLGLSFSGLSIAADYSQPEVAIEARKNQFEDIKASFKQLRYLIIQDQPDLQEARRYADEMAVLSQPLLQMFRTQSASGDTKALPRIWQSWPRFEKQMQDFIDLTEKTAESLKYANKEDARMYVQQTAKSCKSCHRFFKQR